MKRLLATAAFVSMATPALAHLESVPHVHSGDGALWGAALVVAALVAALLKLRRD